MVHREYFVPDEAAMLRFAARLAPALPRGAVVFLRGELGMGKTTLARSVIQTLGHRGAVKSPTYTLVEPYELPSATIYHFDLYRLGDPEELEFMGIRDYFNADCLSLVEWPERGAGFLPQADLVVTIELNGDGRCIHINAETVSGQACVRQLQ